jgi:IS30 family transposase
MISRGRAVEADARAWRAAKRPKATRLALHRPLRTVVAAELLAKRSPAQIAG